MTVEVPEEAFYLSGLQVAKKSITSDLQKYIPEIGSISFMEIFKRADKAESEPIGESAAQGSPLPAEEKPAAKESAEQQAPRKPEPTPRRATTRTARRRPRLGSENQR